MKMKPTSATRSKRDLWIRRGPGAQGGGTRAARDGGVLRTEDPRSLARAVCLALLALAAAAPCPAADAAPQVRQVVIRAPEMEVVGLMAGTTTSSPAQKPLTEAARISALWQAVREGRARVLSDLTSAASPNRGALVRQGRHVWLPTELDQDTDRLQMPPTSYEEYFVGTSLQTGPATELPTFMDWKGECIPRGPVVVKWPVSWLNLYVDFKPDPRKRLIRGWLDFRDTFEESVIGSVELRGARPQILAIMPPADQVWPGDRQGRWLDVFLAHASIPGQPPPPPEAEPAPDPKAKVGPAARPPTAPADPFAPAPAAAPTPRPRPMGETTMLYGVSIPATEAALLLLKRDPAQDAALLGALLARVRADNGAGTGTARLQVCIGSGYRPGSRHSLQSARLHRIPTEMPSIPSAWRDWRIGTSLEMDLGALGLDHDLAPPGRSEWRLAQDDPQAVMWQPRPRSLKLNVESPTLTGTHLVGLLHVPEVMRQQGTGLEDKEESILCFAQHSGHLVSESPHADPPPVFEAEVIVLEMPGSSVDEFEGLPGDPQPDAEDDRFRQLMSRVQTGEVRVAAHAMATANGRSKANLRIAEQHKHATEFDPPEDTPRMRPTALEDIYAGTEMEIETSGNPAPPFEIHVQLSFKHSTALPMEPDLPATLAAAAKNENGPYPDSTHPQEAWTSSGNHATTGSSGITVQDNKPYCLGARKPEGIGRKVIHVAYLRVRRLF